jgi:hypothetical protein
MHFVTVDCSMQLILTLILADIGLYLMGEYLEFLLCFDFHAMYIT